MVLHPGQRNVKVAGQTVMVDGAPFLSLGFFDVGYFDLPQVAALGANTINGLPNFNATDCFNTGQKGYLDQVYELGMNFVRTPQPRPGCKRRLYFRRFRGRTRRIWRTSAGFWRTAGLGLRRLGVHSAADLRRRA